MSYDEQPDDDSFDAVIAAYSQACWHRDNAGMREGYIKLRAMCGAASSEASRTQAGASGAGQLGQPDSLVTDAQVEAFDDALREFPLQARVYGWLGFWRDEMPNDAVAQLQELLGPLAANQNSQTPISGDPVSGSGRPTDEEGKR